MAELKPPLAPTNPQCLNADNEHGPNPGTTINPPPQQSGRRHPHFGSPGDAYLDNKGSLGPRYSGAGDGVYGGV